MNSENKRCARLTISKRSNIARTWSLTLLVLVVSMTALSGCHSSSAPVPPAPNRDWTITATFKYDFTNYSICSATITRGCATGFTWGYSQGGTQVPLKTSPTSICTGATQPQTCTDTVNSVLGIGPTVFYVTANGIDNGGAAVTSGVNNSAIDNVVLIVPTGLTVTRN